MLSFSQVLAIYMLKFEHSYNKKHLRDTVDLIVLRGQSVLGHVVGASVVLPPKY